MVLIGHQAERVPRVSVNNDGALPMCSEARWKLWLSHQWKQAPVTRRRDGTQTYLVPLRLAFKQRALPPAIGEPGESPLRPTPDPASDVMDRFEQMPSWGDRQWRRRQMLNELEKVPPAPPTRTLD